MSTGTDPQEISRRDNSRTPDDAVRPPRCSASEFRECGNVSAPKRGRWWLAFLSNVFVLFGHAPSSTHRTHVARGPRPSACLLKRVLFKKKKESPQKGSKISMVTRSWSCACSRMSVVRARPQQYSIRQGPCRMQRGWDSVKGSQWT